MQAFLAKNICGRFYRAAAPNDNLRAMCAKRPHRRKPNAHRSPPAAATEGVRVRRHGDAWELVHPPCARDRAEDLEEVERMIAAGEYDVAIDELRWLIEGCSEFIQAHRLLGELALVAEDTPLARAHFGVAYDLAARSLAASGWPVPLPYRLEANRAFFEAGKGLVWCLGQLGKEELRSQVIVRLLACDPSDPLGLNELGQESAGGCGEE